MGAAVRNRYFLFLDLLTLPLAVCMAYLLRLDGIDLARYGSGLVLFSALVLVATLAAFWITGVYSRYWRYASVEEMVLLAGDLLMAVFISGVITLAAAPWLPGGGGFPRSIPAIFFFLGLTVTATPRLAIRMAARFTTNARSREDGSSQPSQPVVVMGAGDAGALIVRELQKNPHLGLDPILPSTMPASTGFPCWAAAVIFTMWCISTTSGKSSSPCPPRLVRPSVRS
jgi:FlaA1/EpsC-like NDP-sugar epimerase